MYFTPNPYVCAPSSACTYVWCTRASTYASSRVEPGKAPDDARGRRHCQRRSLYLRGRNSLRPRRNTLRRHAGLRIRVKLRGLRYFRLAFPHIIRAENETSVTENRFHYNNEFFLFEIYLSGNIPCMCSRRKERESEREKCRTAALSST